MLDDRFKQTQSILRIYNYYRFLLIAVLAIAYLFTGPKSVLGAVEPKVYWLALGSYFFIYLGQIIFSRLKQSISTRQLLATFGLDIVGLTILSHASGGIASGLPILYIFTISTAAITLSPVFAIATAALASLAILADTGYLILQGSLATKDFLPAGLLGILNFATALTIQYLAQRIQTSQKIAEESSATAEKLLHLNQQIVQRMRTGILVVSPENNVQFMNHAAEELLNMRMDNSAKTSLPSALNNQVVTWRRSPRLPQPVFEVEETGIEIQASFSALTSGEIQKDTLIFLENSRTIARRAQQLKLASLGRLTASIAHEIRNPLGAMSHAAQLMKESPDLSDADQRLTEIIIKQSERVNGIIENVLTVSRQQAPQPEKLELDSFVKQFIDDYSGAIDTSAEIMFERENDSINEPLIIGADSSQLTQVLTNLVDNGLRYSEKLTGKKQLKIRTGTQSVTQLPYLDIIDFGSGIDATSQENLFEPFYTTENTGTGLGLYLSREMCEANQIHLNYRTTSNNESCFRLSFAHPDSRFAVEQEA